jgi:hypothetical protein
MVSTPAPPSDQRETPHSRESQDLAITDGEVYFLWWFIHGSVLIPETWKALVRAYGLCERHAWVHLSVEMSFRKRHFLGPVILYRALVKKSVQAIETCQRMGLPGRPLQARGACFLCALNIGHAEAGAAPPTRLDRGRDSSGLRSCATDLAALWRPKVCAICAGEASGPSRCRPHLLADLKSHRLVDLSWQMATLEELSVQLARYEDSFVAEAEEPADQDRAALISAVGWCGGWHPLLALLGSSV